MEMNQNQIMELLDTLYAKSINGIPKVSQPIDVLANDYLSKNNSIEKANGGVGIIPFAYKQACDYYYALYLAQMSNIDKKVTTFKTKEIEIGSPRVYVKPPRLFDLGDDEDE